MKIDQFKTLQEFISFYIEHCQILLWLTLSPFNGHFNIIEMFFIAKKTLKFLKIKTKLRLDYVKYALKRMLMMLK